MKKEINYKIYKVFIKNYRVYTSDGSGLGLAIAKSFVELQGGYFNVSIDGDLFKVIIKFMK
ncbi:MAG: hypothetical protein ACRC3Y_01955 [Romboutsia sp.]|uniref:hypothetical protein n=1 Tax=Romboutsia sp. TaxID=1965302 RepID=UPI003F40166B